MSKGLLWAIILTVVFFFILPFPLSFIACIIIGAVIPWITGNNNNNNNNNQNKNQ